MRIKKDGAITHSKRRALLLSLGYVPHPTLPNGRSNRVVLPDGNKPRLFIKRDHPDIKIENQNEVAKAYENAQKI